MAIDPTGIATTLSHQAGRPEEKLNGKNKDGAQAFESYMVELMIQQMRKTIPEGIFQSTGVEMFSSMFDQAVAKEIAESGGFGLAESMAQKMDGGSPFPLSMAIEPGRAVGSATAMGPFSQDSNPVDGGVVTSGYGRRLDPFTGKNTFHKAIDIGAPMGAPIQNLAEGTVTMASANGGYGNVVMVEHGDGWRSLYAHCDSMDVEPGQRVKAGEQLGTVGSSGRSTGPHLHLEIRHQGQRVDPAEVLGW